MKSLSLFIYTEERYQEIRNNIVNYLIFHQNEFIHLEFETEIGVLNITQYIEYIKKDKAWSGELEKYISEEIFNINIVDYLEEDNINDMNNFYHKFFSDCNHDGNYNKDLCILSNIRNIHYNLLYDKAYNCFKNSNNQLIFLNNSTKKNLYDYIENNKLLLSKNNAKEKNIKNLTNVNQNEANKDINNLKNKNFQRKDNVLNLEEDNDNDQEDSDSENNLEYNNTNLLKIYYEKFIINIENKNIKYIIDLYNKTKKNY